MFGAESHMFQALKLQSVWYIPSLLLLQETFDYETKKLPIS